MASMKVRHLLSKAQNYPASRGECCPFCQILGSSKSCMPNKSRSQRTGTVQRPMQSNRRNQAAAAMTKPGEYETGRTGGENGSEDAGDLADHSGTAKAGQPFVTGGQTHRRRDVPQSEHQRTGSGDAAESTDPVQRAVQDATESQLF